MTPRKPAVGEPSVEEPPEHHEPTVDEDRIREIVREMIGAVTPGGEGGDGEPPAKPAGTQAAQEADIESKVRAEIQKLKGEEDRDSRLAALESRVHAEPERAPVKERVSTRLMGWKR